MRDLLAAGKAGGHHRYTRSRFPHRREESPLTDGARQLVVLVAKETGHAAATAVERDDLAIGDGREQSAGRAGADQCLLVAVTVDEDLSRSGLQGEASDPLQRREKQKRPPSGGRREGMQVK